MENFLALYEVIRQRIAAVRELASAATPGPWHFRTANDEWFMSAQYITNAEGLGDRDVEVWDQPEDVIAITLLQEPVLVQPRLFLCDEDSQFILASRNYIPRLCAILTKALDDNELLWNALADLGSPMATGRGDAIKGSGVVKSSGLLAYELGNLESAPLTDWREFNVQIRNLASQATPGPWFLREGDHDEHRRGRFIASTTGPHEGQTAWVHPNDALAMTWLEEPPLAMSEKSIENTRYIVAAREEAIPLCDDLDRALFEREPLVKELKRLLNDWPPR